MARKPIKPPKRRKARKLAVWIRVSKVRLGRRYLYTFVYQREDGLLQTVQVAHDNDSRALSLAKRQVEKLSASAFAYAYAYGGYAYAYGYGGHAYALRRGRYAYAYGYGASTRRTGYGRGAYAY